MGMSSPPRIDMRNRPDRWFQCDTPSCLYRWKSKQGGVPNYCPGCFKKHFHEVDTSGNAVTPPNPPEQPRLLPQPQVPQQGVQMTVAQPVYQQPPQPSHQPSQREASDAIDPKEEFIEMLTDVGLKTKKRIIAEIVFNGKPNDPKWVDSVLDDAGIDVARRKLIIMRKFGRKPKDLGIRVDDGDDEEFKVDEEGHPIDELDDVEELEKMNKTMLKQRVAELRRNLAERKLKLLEAKVGIDDTPKKAEEKKEDDKIEIPATDQKGQPIFDKEGRPVFIKVSPMQLYWMSQMKQQQQPKGDEPTAFEKMLMEDRTFFRNKALSEEGNKENEKLILAWSKDREKMLEGIHKLREEVLRREIRDTAGQVRTPAELFNYVKSYVEMGKQMGLVKEGADPKQQFARELGDKALAQATVAQGEFRYLMQEGIKYIKEERAKQSGESTKPKPLTEDEKKAFYIKGAEDYRAAIIAEQEKQKKAQEAAQQLAAGQPAPVQPVQPPVQPPTVQPQVIENQPDIHPTKEPAQSQPQPPSKPPEPTPSPSSPQVPGKAVEVTISNDGTVKPLELNVVQVVQSPKVPKVQSAPAADNLNISGDEFNELWGEPEIVDELPSNNKPDNKKWFDNDITDGITTNPLDDMEIEEEPQDNQSEPEQSNSQSTAKPTQEVSHIAEMLGKVQPKSTIIENGLHVSIFDDAKEQLTMDVGKFGTKAHIAVVDGKPVVKGLTFTKDISQTEADFVVQKTVEDMKKGTCPICKAAKDALMKQNKGYLLTD